MSLSIFGTQQNHDVIRFLNLFVLLDKEFFFRKILNFECSNSFENFFVETSIIGNFSNHVNTIATPILLNRPIFVYQNYIKKKMISLIIIQKMKIITIDFELFC